MITPTIGRRVWFYPALASRGIFHRDFAGKVLQPADAGVAYVHGDRMINISYADHNGQMWSTTSVPLLQDDDKPPADGFFCTWMPYQKGQAAKQEEPKSDPLGR